MPKSPAQGKAAGEKRALRLEREEFKVVHSASQHGMFDGRSLGLREFGRIYSCIITIVLPFDHSSLPKKPKSGV
jgi:hypothetical protein